VFTFLDTTTTFPIFAPEVAKRCLPLTGVIGSRFPTVLILREHQDFPSSWEPHVHMPCSTTAVDLKTRPFFGLSGLPSVRGTTSASTTPFFEAQSHGLRTPCLRFAQQLPVGSHKNSVPTAASCCRTGLFTCWVPLQSFSLFTSPCPSFFGALHDRSPAWTA